MKVKTLICNCRGLDPFRYSDMNSLAFEVESDFDVAYAAIHAQLCSDGGKEMLQDVLRSAESDPDTYVMVCACQEEMQMKLFRKTLDEAHFDPRHFVPVDARHTSNAGILNRIRARLTDLADPKRMGC